MSRLVTTVTLAGAAIAALVGFLSPAAASAPPPPPPWIVSAPSAPAPTTVFFQAATVGATPQLVLTDTTANQVLTCTSSRLRGAGITGSYPTGTNLVHVIGASFVGVGCGALGVTFKPSGIGNWKFNALTYSFGLGGTSTGRLANINLTWTASGCTFTTTGSVRARYINGGGGPFLQTIAAASNLSVSAVSGCFGVLNVGDQTTLVAKYQLLSGGPNFPIQIT